MREGAMELKGKHVAVLAEDLYETLLNRRGRVPEGYFLPDR